MKLREIENYGFKILTERAKDGSMTVYAKFGEAEKRNKNHRIYPLGIFSREVDRVQEKIAKGQFLGQQDHSDSTVTFLKDVSHVVTKLEMIGNEGYATIKILNTDAGKNCQEIIRGKGRIGISTRAVGTVDAKTGIVQSDLQLLALDLVSDPSVGDATIGKENILEGVEFEEGNLEGNLDTQKQKDLEEAVSDLETQSYLNAVEEGFQGTQADWERIHGGGLRKMMGIKEDDGKNVVQKLTEEQIGEKLVSLYQEAREAGFEGTLKAWKEKYPKIAERASEPIKLSSQKEEKSKQPFRGKYNWEEVVASGFKGTMEEFSKKYPNIKLQKPKVPSLPETISEAEKKVREVEIEQKLGKAIRERVIRRVSNEVFQAGGGVSREQIKEMIEMEIKSEKQRIKELNWQAYKKLLSE